MSADTDRWTDKRTNRQTSIIQAIALTITYDAFKNWKLTGEKGGR